MQIKGSLEKVASRKNVTDDITQSITFHVFATAEEIGRLNALYRKPLRITVEEDN